MERTDKEKTEEIEFAYWMSGGAETTCSLLLYCIKIKAFFNQKKY